MKTHVNRTPEKEVNTWFPAFNPEQWRDFVDGKTVKFSIADKDYDISLIPFDPTEPSNRSALLCEESGNVLWELNVNLSNGGRTFGHLYWKKMDILQKTQDYLNEQKAVFLEQMKVKQAKQATKTQIGKTLEESN